MTLAEFIRDIGPAEFAKRFPPISERTAVSYMYGERMPRPKLAKQIVERTPVGWDGVYAGTSKSRPN